MRKTSPPSRQARQVPEHVCGHRCPHLGTGPAAVHGTQVLREVSGSDHVRHDTSPNREAYYIYYRFLETDDEGWARRGHHRRGFWNIYGIFLPPEGLEKVYRGNAERVLCGEDRRGRRRLRAAIAPTDDFELTGDGTAAAWKKAE